MQAQANANPNEGPPTMIELRKVSKWYGEFQALKEVSLTVRKGERVVICGPSGSGKSTAIRCINRLVEPCSGEILFVGADMVKLDRGALRLARRHIGMVFQEYNLVERLTVMENLLCGRLGYVPPLKAWLRMYPKEDIARAFEFPRPPL